MHDTTRRGRAFLCYNPSNRASIGASSAVSAPFNPHCQPGKRTGFRMHLQRARRADSMRCNPNSQTTRRLIVHPQAIKEIARDDGADNPGHNHQHRRQRWQSANLLGNAHRNRGCDRFGREGTQGDIRYAHETTNNDY